MISRFSNFLWWLTNVSKMDLRCDSDQELSAKQSPSSSSPSSSFSVPQPAQSPIRPRRRMTKMKELKRQRRPKKIDQAPIRGSFTLYTQRMVRGCYDLAVNAEASQEIDDFLVDVFDRIASTAGELARKTAKKTITAREVEFAVRLVLPNGLTCGAARIAKRSLHRYVESYDKRGSYDHYS